MTDELPNIGDVIKHYGGVTNRSSGAGSIKCPFHDDRHASAGINFSKNLFNCFTCGVGGNSLQIIAKQEGISIREARAFAERITGESYGSLRGEHRYGRGLPSKSGNNKGSSIVGSIRRSRAS